MRTRIITAIVSLCVFGAVLAAGAIWGTIPIFAAMGLISLMMLHEVYSAVTDSKQVKLCGYLCFAILFGGFAIGLEGAAVAASIMLAMVFVVGLHGKVGFKEVCSSVLVTMYISIFMHYIPRTASEWSMAVMGIVFVIAWGSDTAAYFCGTFFGKHKLIPHVSPKKTVEGSVGALICTGLLCMLYLFIMRRFGLDMSAFGSDGASYALVGVMGVIGAALSQLGDLTASALKRDAGIKDYGKIFPGHGGFMDRFDSVVFIAPFVYYFLFICGYIYVLITGGV